MKRTTTLIAAGLATLVLGACGGESDSAAPPATTAASATTPSATTPSTTTAPSAEHNDADIMFAQMMIQHHRQAVEMAKLVEGRASSPEVKKLAAAIEAAQGPEIRTMSTWLTTWGEEVPAESMPGMDHGGHGGMPGMMSEADMMTLEALSGSEFDKSWLTMMVAHHQGAVQMAQQQQKDGENPEAVALAKKIQSDQAAEITTMKGLLGTT
jgi:uncharacterized protein (DUF305 family)